MDYHHFTPWPFNLFQILRFLVKDYVLVDDDMFFFSLSLNFVFSVLPNKNNYIFHVSIILYKNNNNTNAVLSAHHYVAKTLILYKCSTKTLPSTNLFAPNDEDIVVRSDNAPNDSLERHLMPVRELTFLSE